MSMMLDLSKATPEQLAAIQAIMGMPQQEAPPSKKRRGRKLPKVLSEEQFDKLLSPINQKCNTGLRNYVIFQTAYKAGLRVSEICNLTPADIDLTSGKILVQNGKGGKDRVVPIGHCLMDMLRSWDDVRPQQATYFFCTLQGGRLNRNYFNEVLGRLSKKSGVYIQDGAEQKPVHMHCLRHSYATNLLDKGVNIREVQELLGHENLSTTQVYTAVNMTHLDAKIKALDD